MTDINETAVTTMSPFGDLPKLETTQDHIDFFMRDYKCTCKFCARSKRFAAIINKLESEDDKRWMLAMYDGLVESEEYLGMLEYERNNPD